jgi:hypothetical protein
MRGTAIAKRFNNELRAQQRREQRLSRPTRIAGTKSGTHLGPPLQSFREAERHRQLVCQLRIGIVRRTAAIQFIAIPALPGALSAPHLAGPCAL